MTPVLQAPERAVLPHRPRLFRGSWRPDGTKGRWIGLAVSLLAHTVLGGGLYWGFYERSTGDIVADLDLTLSPLSGFGGAAGGGKPSEAWYLPSKGKKVPPRLPAVQTKAPTIEDVKAEEASACSGDNCTGQGRGSGSGFGDGVMDAAEASQKPRWVRNMITSADYPRVAQQSGKDGLVVLQVLLDETGRVRDARLLQGAYDVLNEIALRKVRGAVFTPARDKSGRPASCRMTLPIRFALR
jgi:TonB family protein